YTHVGADSSHMLLSVMAFSVSYQHKGSLCSQTTEQRAHTHTHTHKHTHTYTHAHSTRNITDLSPVIPAVWGWHCLCLEGPIPGSHTHTHTHAPTHTHMRP